LLAVHGCLETDLASVMMPSVDGNILSYGDTTGLQFAARMITHTSPSGSAGEIATIGYRWGAAKPGAAMGALVRVQSPINDNQSVKQGKAQTLLTAQKASFEYFDSVGQRWVNSWDSKEQDKLPSLLRINLYPTDAGDHIPLSLTFAIQTGRVYVGTPKQ
jgi:hypothetical protein